jgi:hypothetical protein
MRLRPRLAFRKMISIAPPCGLIFGATPHQPLAQPAVEIHCSAGEIGTICHSGFRRSSQARTKVCSAQSALSGIFKVCSEMRANDRSPASFERPTLCFRFSHIALCPGPLVSERRVVRQSGVFPHTRWRANSIWAIVRRSKSWIMASLSSKKPREGRGDKDQRTSSGRWHRRIAS